MPQTSSLTSLQNSTFVSLLSRVQISRQQSDMKQPKMTQKISSQFCVLTTRSSSTFNYHFVRYGTSIKRHFCKHLKLFYFVILDHQDKYIQIQEVRADQDLPVDQTKLGHIRLVCVCIDIDPRKFISTLNPIHHAEQKNTQLKYYSVIFISNLIDPSYD